MTLTQIYEALSAPFPKEALSPLRRDDKVLTSIKAQYIVERLNTVLGLGNWRLDGSWEAADEGVMFFGDLIFTIEGKELRTGPVSGFSDSDNPGDAYKAARTDCLSKAASLLGVGNEVFKGLVNLETEESVEEEEQEVSAPAPARSRFTPRKAAPVTKTAEVEEEQTDDEAEQADEEEVQPRQPSKLKSSRMFRRPTEKLNR